MKLTKEMFGTTMGDIDTLFNTLNTREEFEEFYKVYWQLVEEQVCKDNNITWGDKRPFAETYDRVRSNLSYLLNGCNEMRKNYAYKVYWFLWC